MKASGHREVAEQTYEILHGGQYVPPVQNLADIDVYKLFMGQLIQKYYKNVKVTFGLIVRDKRINIWKYVDEEELRKSLDHAMSLRFRKTDLYYLRGMDLYQGYMFDEGYLSYLRDFKLPEYKFATSGGARSLEFAADWGGSDMWETIAMSILSELYYRGVMKTLSKDELYDMYAVANNRLQHKLIDIASNPRIKLADFGTRRRHSHLWQRYVLGEARRVLGDQITGTSNLWMAEKYDMNAIGTFAHAPVMVATALESTDEGKRNAQYEVLKKWESIYGQGLRIMLPDTYGSAQFYANAPSWLTTWRGQRQDSGDPAHETMRYVEWLRKSGIDPKDRVSIASDGLDVNAMISISDEFADVIATPFGYGTGLTNDFGGTLAGNNDMRPFSMVVKPVSANGSPCVKLSNDVSKATGPAPEIEKYIKIFGGADRVTRQVLV